MCIEWCKNNKWICAAIVVFVLLIIWNFVLAASGSGAERITQPSVLVNPNFATAMARSAQDIARDYSGSTIRDYELEDKLLSNQGLKV